MSLPHAHLVDASAGPSGARCKLIVAAEAPWEGEMYRTRPGHQRLGFDSVETFCSSLLALTGWTLPAPTEHRAPPAARFRPTVVGETRSARQKFIVSATTSWTGEVYRTRPGLSHVGFTSFEQLLHAVLGVSGWPLDLPARGRTESAGAPQRRHPGRDGLTAG